MHSLLGVLVLLQLSERLVSHQVRLFLQDHMAFLWDSSNEFMYSKLNSLRVIPLIFLDPANPVLQISKFDVGSYSSVNFVTYLEFKILCNTFGINLNNK